ncbi:Pentatricopeptide repeat-containing protein [Nymphaea thermarum]|nr:Pentatricopeptide repeat-containing protein [Nymphaea thermarum]
MVVRFEFLWFLPSSSASAFHGHRHHLLHFPSRFAAHFSSTSGATIQRHGPPHFESSTLGDVGKKLKGLCVSGRLGEAVNILCSEGLVADGSLYASLLQECVDLKDFRSGRRVHAHMMVVGFTPDEYLRTKLLILYSKSGDLFTAHQMFDRMPDRNLVAWNSLISGYAESGRHEEALGLYAGMRSEGVAPDQFTFASVIKACAALAKLEQGRRVHGGLIKSGIKGNVVVGSALVDMYCKCSSISDARRAFDGSRVRNVVTWTALIAGYGLHGHVAEVLQLFHQMISEGLRPNHVTFLAVLCACSRAGLVAEAWKYFNLMAAEYGMKPKAEHCAAMVDLMARAGKLDEAHQFVKFLPFKHHSVLWGTLLGASRVHGHLQLATVAANRLFELEPDNAGKYVVLSNVYAARGLWRKVAEVREVMKENGIKKEPACSWIEVQREVHAFLVGDRSHPNADEIYRTIKRITILLKDAAARPNDPHI